MPVDPQEQATGPPLRPRPKAPGKAPEAKGLGTRQGGRRPRRACQLACVACLCQLCACESSKKAAPAGGRACGRHMQPLGLWAHVSGLQVCRPQGCRKRLPREVQLLHAQCWCMLAAEHAQTRLLCNSNQQPTCMHEQTRKHMQTHSGNTCRRRTHAHAHMHPHMNAGHCAPEGFDGTTY